MDSDTAAEKLVTKGEESLTKLHESRFFVSKWWWGVLIAATLGFGWLVVKLGRDYFYNVHVLRVPHQTSLLVAAAFLLFILAVCWAIGLYEMYGGVHYVIHSDGLRVAGQVAYVGRFVYGLEFSDFEDVRIGRW